MRSGVGRRAARFVTLSAIAGIVAAGCGAERPRVVLEEKIAIVTTTTVDGDAGRVVADWPMTDAASTTEMTDRSGNGHIGIVGDAVERTGASFRFAPIVPGVADVARIVVVESSEEFEPVDEPLTISVRVRTTSSGEHNIVQKGQSTTEGGFWKMEINANGRTPGIPHCTFKGTILAGVVSSDVRVDDGRWHTISCRRTRTAVEIDVDGAKHRESSVTGPMSNTYPIAIAGKAECNPAREIECDYFTGELADLRIVVG